MYKNREERTAVEELGKKYSLDSKSTLNKIKILRSYFHREHSKVLKKKSGSSDDEIYRSSWCVCRHMVLSCKVMKAGKENTQQQHFRKVR
jgi:hypothetical protein